MQMKSEQMPEEEVESSPLDSIIERVRSYKTNPKMVTPETLGELETELMDLKGYVDGEETEEKPMESGMGKNGLTVILGKVAK